MSKGLGLVVFGGLLVFVIISFVTFTDSGQSLWDEVFPEVKGRKWNSSNMISTTMNK